MKKENDGPSMGPVKDGEFLHQLIKRLEPDELNYIKAQLVLPKYADAYRLLLDLRKQSELNENLLRPKYEDLIKVKFRLRGEVMRLLRTFHDQLSIDQEIAQFLLNEQILYKKGLYEQAEKELEMAQGLAEKYQRLGRLLEILQLKQFRIIERKTKDLGDLTRANLGYLAHTLEMYIAQLQAFALHQERFAAYRIGGTPVLDESEEKVAAKAWPANDFYLQLYQNSLLSLEANMDGHLDKAVEILRLVVALFESFPPIQAELQVNYKLQLANLGVLLVGIGHYDEVREIMRKLKALRSKDLNEEAETWQNVIHLELLLMVNELHFEGQNNLIQRVEEGLAHYDAKINPARRLSILYNLMVLYIINQNFSMARKKMDLIISHRKFEVRKEIQYTTRLLEMLIAFELDGGNMSDSTTTAVRRYLKRQDQLVDFKRQVVLHLERICRAEHSEHRNIFGDLKAVLALYIAERNHPDHLGLVIVRAWVESRLSHGGVSIKDCF